MKETVIKTAEEAAALIKYASINPANKITQNETGWVISSPMLELTIIVSE